MHETYQDYIDFLGPETTQKFPQALLHNHNKISKQHWLLVGKCQTLTYQDFFWSTCQSSRHL